LESCIQKYKSLKSYEDLGSLSMRLPGADASSSKLTIEPIRIAFETPNRLAIQSRGLQAMWSSNGTVWEAVVGKDDYKPFGSQRLVRPLPESIDLTWLIVDHLGALIDDFVLGSPIQLQLLFDQRPLAYFLEPDSKFSLLSAETFDGKKCERVQLIAKESKWVFWIDQESSLLRKYELPVEAIRTLVPNLPLDFDLTKCELSVDLVGAKANQNVDWSTWKIPNVTADVPVRRFIDAPPRNTPPLIGKNLKQFDLRGPDGKAILDSAQRTKPITVLCWVTNDAIGEAFVEGLFSVKRELDKRLLSQVEIVLVSQAKPDEIQASLKRWNCSLPLAIDSENLTKNLFGIQTQPAVVIIDKLVRVHHFDEFQFLAAIPNIVEELQAGIDVASRRLLETLDNEARFNSRLHRAMLDKSQTALLPPIEAFPFSDYRSKDQWNVSFTDAIIAAGCEPFYPQAGLQADSMSVFSTNAKRQRLMTVLDELGHVHTVDNTGKSEWIASIPIEQAANPKRIHVLPDPWSHRWIAIVPEGLPRYWLIDLQAKSGDGPADAKQYDLEEDESPVAFVWAVKDGTPMLTIATNQSKLKVLDPQADKRLVGNAGNVVAIVPNINDRGECFGWNAFRANGEIEELEDLRSSSAPVTDDESNLRPKKLTFTPEPSNWAWGRDHNQGLLLGMAQLPSGETGTILQSRFFSPLLRHPLSVRPEQCKILSTATIQDGSLFWLSTAPNRILHLQTAGGYVADQMSLGKKIVGAGLFPDGNNLRMVLAVDSEVNCWSIEVPRPPVPLQPPPAIEKRESISPGDKTGA